MMAPQFALNSPCSQFTLYSQAENKPSFFLEHTPIG